MKTLLVIISISCIFSVSMNAQFSQGKWFAGSTTDVSSGLYSSAYTGGGNQAGISFMSNWSKSGSQTSDKEKSTAWNLSPKVGYFVIDGLLVGLDLNIRGESWKDEDGDKDNLSILTFGPFVRYYGSQWAFVNGKLVPFAETKFLFGNYKNKYTSGSTTNTIKEGITEFAIGPGLAFVISECLSVDMLIAYKRVSWKDTDGAEDYTDITSAFGFAFGLSFYFACGGE